MKTIHEDKEYSYPKRPKELWYKNASKTHMITTQEDEKAFNPVNVLGDSDKKMN